MVADVYITALNLLQHSHCSAATGKEGHRFCCTLCISSTGYWRAVYLTHPFNISELQVTTVPRHWAAWTRGLKDNNFDLCLRDSQTWATVVKPYSDIYFIVMAVQCGRPVLQRIKHPIYVELTQCQPISISFIEETISITIFLMPSNCVSKATWTSKSSNRTSKRANKTLILWLTNKYNVYNAAAA